METMVKTRTQVFLGSAAIALVFNLGAMAQPVQNEQPRGQMRSQDTRPQAQRGQVERGQVERGQAERMQDTNRQKADTQAAQPRTAGEARDQSRAGATQQGQGQSAMPPAAGQAQPAQNGAQQPAQPGQAQRQTAPSQGQAATPQQPAAQAPSGQAGNQPVQSPSRQTAQPQRAPAAPAQGSQNANQNAQQRAAITTLNTQQQSQIGRTIAQRNVKPLTNVNFSISIGTRVPRSVQLRALPADLVTVVPQYRGYSYFVVEQQVVIVEPATHEIVTIIPYTASTTTATRTKSAPMTSRSVSLDTRQRDVIREHATQRKATRTTSEARRHFRTGDRVDQTVITESFPETIYTEVPAIRRYRYFTDDADVYLVDPDDDRVVEVIR